MFNPIYVTNVLVNNGRDGVVVSQDRELHLSLVMSEILGGTSKRKGTNPEQLLGACLGACLGSTIQAVAKMNNQLIEGIAIRTRVTLGRLDDNGFQLAIQLEFSAQSPSMDQLIPLAHDAMNVSPYMKALRGNVEIQWKVVPYLLD
ncbi:MAG: Ohr family peroxiredoxin [Bacteroidota bacterium]